MISTEKLFDALPNCLDRTDFPELGEKYEGKVRDVYFDRPNGRRTFITTDRVSGFDRILGLIPYKGQVLNQLAAWWFEQTADLVKNHVVSVPDPNVIIGREAEMIPIEVVVRGYITGVTTTSLWYLYENGERNPYGIPLPDGMQKYDALPRPIITPTTKAPKGEHDERITRDEILERQIVPTALWEQIEETALAVFARGQQVARDAGLILVDTKYEFGLIDGELALTDEIHTPDSSRFWIADTWGNRQEPENYDKEFLRKWYAAQGYRGEGPAPAMPDAFRVQVAERYIGAYKRLTGNEFVVENGDVVERIRKNLIG